MSTVDRAQPAEDASDTATTPSDITLTASTATRLLTAAGITPIDMPCRAVIVTSDPANLLGVYIRVGDANVGAARGQKLAPGQSYTYTVSNARDVWAYTTGIAQIVQMTIFS